MTLLERVEKKIFFRIVRSITFFVAFLALIATIAGLYASISSSIEAKPKNVQIHKEEIERVLKPEVQTSSPTTNQTLTNEKETAPETTQVDPETAKLNALAESIAKEALTSIDIKVGIPDYKQRLESSTRIVLNYVTEYDYDTKIITLTKLQELSKSFPKEKYLNSIDVYFSLFKSKHDHEQVLAEQKNAAAQANKIMGYEAVGSGVIVFALFVMILVLLRIEKNTRPATTETDEYDATDKKLLIGIIVFAIIIASLIGWGIDKTMNNDEEFDPVSDLHSAYSTTAPVAEEAAAPAEATAPATEYNTPAADATETYNTEAPAAPTAEE